MAKMQHIVRKSIRSGARVLDPFLATASPAKACLVELSHRNCNGFGSDGSCVVEIMPSLRETFESQIPKKDLDIVETAEVKNAARLFQHCKYARSSLASIAWKPPKDLLAVKSSPLDVTKVISWWYCGIDLCVNAKHILCAARSDKWLAGFSGFDSKALSAQEFVMHDMAIKSFTIRHLSTG